MSIYQPYFYVIQDTLNGMYYAGAKWGKDANPSNFLIEDGYKTSSKIIKQLIKKNGLNSFVVRKIKRFPTNKQAQAYETKFLCKIDARNNSRFYNCHNNDGAMNTLKMQMLMVELYGCENPFQSDEIKERIKETNIRKYGVEHYPQSEDYKKSYHKTCIEKYGVPFHTQSESTKEAQKKTNLEKRGVENPSHCPLVAKKISISTKNTKGTNEWKSTKGKEQSIRNSDYFTGKTNITNGIITRWFDPNTEEMPEGWKFGKAKQIKQTGRICVNDGSRNKFVNPEEIPDGWVKGRLKKR